MKAISLWQPWASLMAMGIKKNETRGWSTSYSGPLLIHAAKKRVTIPDDLMIILMGIGFNPEALTYGAIVGKVDLVLCEKITEGNLPHRTLERDLGDYTPGRFMWITENPREFQRPIPFKGSQGFFNVPDELIVRTKYR